MIHDGITVGSLILRELLLQFFDDLVEGVFWAIPNPLKHLFGSHFLLNLGEPFIVRTDHLKL